MKKRVAVVGAGPGGLTAAMLLAHRGFEVSIFERQDRIGGRNGRLSLGDYHFDIGPTFLMMTFILREVFEGAGRNLDDYLKITSLNPMYSLNFPGVTIEPTADHAAMREQIERLFPGEGEGFDRFLAKEKARYDHMSPCLQKPYGTLGSLFSSTLLKAVPHLSVGKTLYEVLAGYFKSEILRISFTFQAKYIGMSPWNCPGLYAMLPYVEHDFGVDHVEGGLSEISAAMARAVEEEGGTIRLSTPVKQVATDGDGVARGVMLEDGSVENFDAVVLNADFGYAASELFGEGVIRKWTRPKMTTSPTLRILSRRSD
ncbi:MAG: phytoene desaturase family protein [Planctomycetota bacterium]|jgi:phytoene desaturase